MNDLTRKALEFYSDPENWQSPSTGFALQYDPKPSPAELDKGDLARAAIQAAKGQSEKEAPRAYLCLQILRAHHAIVEHEVMSLREQLAEAKRNAH
jgi:hypothetical protein